MEEELTSQEQDALASAQRLRFSRVLRGTLSFACTAHDALLARIEVRPLARCHQVLHPLTL